ncbi:MAG: EF-hand domain-containing protein [Thermodesulfobacteriota bacterium]
MKMNNYFLTLVAFFMMFSIVAANHALASSYNKGNYKTADGHGQFNKQFKDIDINGDNSLSFDEFKNVFPSAEQKAFDYLDSDKNKTLSHEEWLQFKKMHSGMGKYHKQKYHTNKLPDPLKFNAHFPDMDSDNNNRVTLEEFKAYFPEASEHEDVFNAIDLDGTGDLNHDEWHEFKAAHGMKRMD